MLLDDEGYQTECDWCGKYQDWRGADGEARYETESDINHRFYIWPEFFRIDYNGQKRGLRLPPDFPEDLCRQCADDLTPWVQKFADIELLKTYVNKLWRTINEQRKQNR